MAGKNINLKPGQVLFRTGDESDGMYIIRKGELKVFMEVDGKEISLATVSAGSMIGEMALFDKKPRSASVKAVATAEVTQISNTDFQNLMKQIPKWFVSLMGTLSGRLRTTNNRLQKIEGDAKPSCFQTTIRILHVLNLLWHKDGLKEGKKHNLEKQIAVEAIQLMFGEDADKLEGLLRVLSDHKLIEIEKNNYNALVLSVTNRGILPKFIEFFDAYTKENKKQPYLPAVTLEILDCLQERGSKEAYDSFTISLDDLTEMGQKKSLPHVEEWKSGLAPIKTANVGVQLVKTSDGSLGLKVDKKEIGKSIYYHKIIHAMHETALL